MFERMLGRNPDCFTDELKLSQALTTDLAAVMARLLVLREAGARADAPFWTASELRLTYSLPCRIRGRYARKLNPTL